MLFVMTFSHEPVAGKPYSMLLSSKPMCVKVAYPLGSKLSIDYDAPDLNASGDERPFAKELKHHRNDPRLIPPGYDGNGPELLHPDKSRERMQEMADNMLKNHPDLTISIYHESPQPGSPPTPAMKTFDILESSGSLEYEIDDHGYIRICAQSIMASRINPRRVHLQLRELFPIFVDNAPDQSAVLEHMSILEQQLRRLTMETESLLRMAEDAKAFEAEFHRESKNMNAAASWWPMVQVVILLGTGFTQANHMVRFFKRWYVI